MKPWAKISLWPPDMPKGDTGPPQRVDLCGKCYEDFINWVEEGDNG
jgi:hypothetical protein